MNDRGFKAQVDFWESHPGADEIRIAIKHLVKLQQDIMELRYNDYLYDLMDIAGWISELLADDIIVFGSNRIFQHFVLLRDDITARIEAKRKRIPRHGKSCRWASTRWPQSSHPPLMIYPF